MLFLSPNGSVYAAQVSLSRYATSLAMEGWLEMWAVMDIGTNSCRLLMARLGAGGKVETVCRLLRTTRIGAGMNQENKSIHAGALARTMEALAEFSREIKRIPIPAEVILVGTQAVREAENRQRVIDTIKAVLGWQLEVLSGEREAWLSYLGAVQELPEKDPLVIDIGGGSTELVRRREEGGLQVVSLPLGALRLYEKPQSHIEISAFLARAIGAKHGSAWTGNKRHDWNDPGVPLVGVGGTCTTAAAVKLALQAYDPDLVQGYRMTAEDIRCIYQKLESLRAEERLKVAGIFPGREDIILPGLQILLNIMTFLAKTEITISDHDLLYGLIYEKLGII